MNFFKKKKEYDPNEGTTQFSISHEDMKKTAVTQCETHVWRKLNDSEIACSICPTVNIVNNPDEYVTS